MTVPEEVDARRGRSAEGERSFRIDLAHTRCGQVDEVRHGACTPFLREPDQLQEDLRRRLRIGKCTVTRARLRAEELRERAEPGAAGPPGEQATREADRVNHRPCQPPTGQPLRLAVDEAQVEARVVRDEHCVARKLEKAAHCDGGMRLAAQLRVVQAREGADRRPERDAGIDEQLELFRELEVAYAHGADLADARAPGPKARCLEIYYDERGVLEQDLGSGRIGEPHRIAPPGQPRVLSDDLFEQASGEPDGRLPQGKEAPCRILGVDGAPPLLDQLDEPVGRIQSQLHGESLGEHMFVCNDRAEMTLSQLALTVLLLAALGLGAHRLGVSAIPAYLLTGLLLGPHEPHLTSLITPSEVTEFVAELGIVFLLFFLGLEFSLGRLGRSSRHVGLGGMIDLFTNAAVGLVVGVAAFGLTFGALILAAAVYVSSSAITVKGLIDFRRLADEETDLVLAILLFEDLAIAFVLGFAATGGGTTASTLGTVGKAIAFIGISLAASRWLSRPLDRVLDWLPREFFLLCIVGILVGMAALAKELGLSEAIGALMAGVVLAETSVREEIEERFFSFRDVFGALFFFVFGLSIDVGALGRLGWLLALAVPLTILGKTAAGYFAGRVGGFTPRQSFNAGVALIAHGEFTIILAQLASGNTRLSDAVQSDLTAFAGLYVLATATIGVVLMKESKWIGRRLFPAPTLISEE